MQISSLRDCLPFTYIGAFFFFSFPPPRRVAHNKNVTMIPCYSYLFLGYDFSLWQGCAILVISSKSSLLLFYKPTGEIVCIQTLGPTKLKSKGLNRDESNHLPLKTDPKKKKVEEGPCFKNMRYGASLVAQWLRICLPMQGTQVRALVWEDPTCRGATGPVSHNY